MSIIICNMIKAVKDVFYLNNIVNFLKVCLNCLYIYAFI